MHITMDRRKALKSGLGTLCALGTAIAAGPAAATASEASLANVSPSLRAKIAAALRSTNNEGCMEVAARLAKSAGARNLQLHLRGLARNRSGLSLFI